MKQILDISTYNNLNAKDYDDIAKSYDGVIMRIGFTGWGKPAKNKVVDNRYETHDRELRKRNVPLGIYWYGTDESTSEAIQAAKVCLSLAKGRSYPLGVFYDTEDNYYQRAMSKNTLTAIVNAFTEYIDNSSSYKTGVYASSSWFKNELHFDQLTADIMWEANYGSNNDNRSDRRWYKSHIHQYTSNHYINGKRFDNNIVYIDYFGSTPNKPKPSKTNEEIAKEVWAGKWGNGSDRKKRLEAAGYDYSTIQAIVNGQPQPKPPVKKTNEQIAAEVKLGLWGNGADRKKRLTAAGYNYGAIQAIVNGGGSTATVKVGDTVKVLRAVQYNGKPFRVWTNKYTVSEIKGDRAVIKQGSTTIAAVNIKDLQKI